MAKPLPESGIKVLHEPNKDAIDHAHQGVEYVKAHGSFYLLTICSIVATHGIGADPDTTWAGRGPAGERVNWLADPRMLPKAVPNARIMRFGYQSIWFGSCENGSQPTHPPKKTFASQVADMLLGELEHYRRGITRPIIFIAHSYGGLVLIQALRSSFDDRAEWLNPFGHTAGLVFFGTPFRGRQGLSLQQMVEAIAQCNPEIRIYPETMAFSVEENPLLEDLVFRFTKTRVDYPIPIQCFYETQPTPISRVLKNSSLTDGYLVPQHSACLDISQGIKRKSLERNHYNLQKFPGPEDMGYRAVEKEIVDLVKGAESFRGDNPELKPIQRNDLENRQVQKLLADLAADHERYKNFNPMKVKNTYGWFLEDPSFRSWCDSVESSFLWVSAGPGCGKSVLSRSLIDERQLSNSATTSVVCYYFFKDGDDTRQRSVGALSAILHQLFIQDLTRKFVRHALPRHKNYGKALATNFSELWNILLECVTTPDAGEIVCVLDAPDECEKEDRNTIIDKLEDFFSSTGQASHPCRLKFFITSRPYDTIERSIGNFMNSSCLRIDRDDHSSVISEDINRVIDDEIPNLMSHLKQDNLRRISKRLKGMKNRTYLWLRLTFYIIKQSPSGYSRPSDMETLLNNLPGEHSAAYEKILDQKKSKYTRILFQLMLAATQPLSIDEANHALTLATAEASFASHSKVKEGLWDAKSFKSAAKNFCGLLVDFHDSKLSFIHQTVREFLTDCPQENATWNWRGRFKLPECHGAMSRSCIRYLSLPDFDSSYIPLLVKTRYPFFHYAAENWPFHYREQDQNIHNNLLKEARNLCRVDKGTPKKCMKMRLSVRNLQWTDLSCAAYFRLEQVVRAIIDENVDVDEYCGYYGTALHAGARRGFSIVVEMCQGIK